MLKPFILMLIFEASATTTGLHNIEFTSRQLCEAGKLTIQSKAKQQGRSTEDGKKVENLRLIDAVCLEK